MCGVANSNRHTSCIIFQRPNFAGSRHTRNFLRWTSTCLINGLCPCHVQFYNPQKFVFGISSVPAIRSFSVQCRASHCLSMMRVNVLRQSVLVSQKDEEDDEEGRDEKKKKSLCDARSSLSGRVEPHLLHFHTFHSDNLKFTYSSSSGERGLGKWENSTSKASHVCRRRIRIKVNGGGRKRGQKSERVELKNIFINPQKLFSSSLGCLPNPF